MIIGHIRYSVPNLADRRHALSVLKRQAQSILKGTPFKRLANGRALDGAKRTYFTTDSISLQYFPFRRRSVKFGSVLSV